MGRPYRLKELSIELSNRCLLRCMHCSSGSAPLAFPDELTLQKVEELIIQARDLGATILSLSGGDPILDCNHAADYIALALRIGYERILFYTTGVRSLSVTKYPIHHMSHIIGMPELFLRMVRKLPGALDKVSFIFSLHSHRHQVNDYIMGQDGVTSVIIDNIRAARLAGFNVEVHMVPMLPNWQDVSGLRDVCERMGVSRLSLLRFVPQTRGKVNNRRLALNLKEFAKLQCDMYDLQCACNPVTDVRLGCPIDFTHVLYSHITEKRHWCHAGRDLILVRPRGDVHPCAAWKTLPEMDNVRNSSLEEIWDTGEVFLALREYHESGWKRIQGKCASCRYQPSCKSGCPAQRMHALKLAGMRSESSIIDLYIDAPDPLCPAWV